MLFSGFKKDGIKFLTTLYQNNTKEWFENHRDVWERNIHDPNIAFVEDMGETLQILVPIIQAKPKVSGSLFKIYRDVRFSKDKTPIKSKIGILFYQGLAHRMQCSSFYLHYTKDEYFIATGIRAFKSPLLKTYRTYLQDERHRISLHNILEDIKQKGYKLPEPKYKRVPKEFKKDDSYIYLALYGSMFAYDEYKIDSVFYSQKLLTRCFKIYEDMYMLQQWVYNMTLSSKE